MDTPGPSNAPSGPPTNAARSPHCSRPPRIFPPDTAAGAGHRRNASLSVSPGRTRHGISAHTAHPRRAASPWQPHHWTICIAVDIIVGAGLSTGRGNENIGRHYSLPRLASQSPGRWRGIEKIPGRCARVSPVAGFCGNEKKVAVHPSDAFRGHLPEHSWRRSSLERKDHWLPRRQDTVCLPTTHRAWKKRSLGMG